jgi:hypothetical protein
VSVRAQRHSHGAPRALTWAVAVTAAVLIVAGTVHALKAALALRAAWPRDADTLLLPRPGVLRLLSFGHPEMASDLVAARANVYFGTQLATRGDQRRLAQALETAVDLDPRFHRLYLRGAAMLVYNGQAFTVDTLTEANHLLERGERAFPDDWELPFQRGFNLLFELPKLTGEDDPRVPDWRQRGVDALRQAATLDGAPPWLANLAARLLTKEGGEELAIRDLEQTYALTSNEETRAEIARKLSELRQRHAAAALAEDAAALARAVAERYPYAPEAFSIIEGPRLKPGVDLDTLLGLSKDPTTPKATP